MLKVFYWLLFTIFLTGDALAAPSVIECVQRAEKSLVLIKTVYTKSMPSKGRIATYERNGAGIIIDASGLIVTNTHIIINAPHIYVILHNGKKLEAQVAYVDPVHDFSLLKILPPSPLKPIAWANSSLARLGENIVAIGSSEHNNQSILGGQITGLIQSRSNGTIEMIELNLALYKGDSGGPILDTQGRLLGIVMGKNKSEKRKSFAIASDKIREQYVHYKKKMK